MAQRSCVLNDDLLQFSGAGNLGQVSMRKEGRWIVDGHARGYAHARTPWFEIPWRKQREREAVEVSMPEIYSGIAGWPPML